MSETKKPTVRYFQKFNAARPIEHDGQIFQFEVCDYIAGSYRGVFKDADGAIPDAVINTPENKSGKAIEITEQEYLSALQKKRPSTTSGVKAVDSYKSPNEKPVAPSAEPSNVDEVDITKVDELVSAEDQKAQSVITSYKKLSEATGVTEDRIKELNKREDSPERSTKGWKLAEWKEYLALIEEPTAE